VIVDWDDASVDWSTFDAVVIRSTWNYHQQPDAFAEWIERVSAHTTLHNAAAIVRWNLDKRYLADVVAAGFPVIATTFVDNDAALDGTDLRGDIMVKPTVSAGSNDTARFTDAVDDARGHAKHILAARKVVMVQPYLSTIDSYGETGLLYFNGQFSHAFRKGAIFATGDAHHNGLYVEEDIGERVAPAHERDLGDRVVAWVAERFGQMPLYARVDVVSTSDSTAEIMEIELIEPSLFLHTAAQAPANAAQAIAAVL
jgi:glutathione synthase/RimK-type ligase-like ATP-grasp enzyme